MPVDTPSLFSRVIQEHLELKRRNAALDEDMPLARYMVDDPFSNHPLFKSEEQARLEETADGPSMADVTMLLGGASPKEDTAEHTVLNVAAVEGEAPAAPAAPAPAASAVAEEAAPAVPPAPAEAAAPAPTPAPPAPVDELSWGRSRDFDWGD